jgi:Ca-activated chloride channel homolog
MASVEVSPMKLFSVPATCAVVVVALSAACDMSGYPGPGALGVTPGGSQDISYARTVIEQGQVPARGEFSAEGLFSEHDLPFTSAPTCDVVLCPHAAAAVVDPVDGSGRGALVHIGFQTNITEDFERGPLDLALAVDISGSMSEGDKMSAVRQALSTLVGKLDENDTLSLVAFDDNAALRFEKRVMDDVARLEALGVIEGLGPQGGTNIESGLLLAYQQLVDEREGASRRVMLFTDAMPNVGLTGDGEFTDLVNEGADMNIGLSAFGVGLNFGAPLMDAIAKTRGGNAFYLEDSEKIATVFDEDFDLIVTPLAFDLSATIARADGVTLRRAYGAPTDDAALDVDFAVSTLFLSRNRGGMGVVLSVPAEMIPAPPPDVFAQNGKGDADSSEREPVALGTFHLSYELANGERVERDVDVTYDGGRQIEGVSTEADDVGVWKMGVLIDEFLALEAAADACAGALDEQTASLRVAAAQERLAAIAGQLSDAPLESEAALMSKLGENLASGTGCRAPIDDNGTL